MLRYSRYKLIKAPLTPKQRKAKAKSKRAKKARKKLRNELSFKKNQDALQQRAAPKT